MCAIYLYEEEQDVTLPVDCLGRVAPAKQDKVWDLWFVSYVVYLMASCPVR